MFIRRLLTAGALAISLSACSVSIDSPDSRDSHTPIVKPSPSVSVDDQYVSVVAKRYPEFGEPAFRPNLIRFGHNVCTTFEAGGTTADVIDAIVNSTPNRRFQNGFAYAAGAAVQFYCPKYLSKIGGNNA